MNGQGTVKKLLDAEVSVREATIRALVDAGIDMVFGIPGGDTGLLFDALYDHRDTVRTVLVREESLAGVMAQVYGRLTGKPGVAIGQAAFMLGASVGVLEAHLSGSPMLLLTDVSAEARFAHHGSYQSGTGEYGSWDAVETFKGFTKAVSVARGGAQTVQCTQLAIKHAMTGEPGPVVVIYPFESLRGRVGPDSIPALFPTTAYLTESATAIDAKCVATATELLLNAERPVIIAGGGVSTSRAFEELRSLAEALSAPVVTTAGGKGAFPEVHPLAVGVFGNFGVAAANAIVGAADIILVVGSKLSPSDTANHNPELIDPARQVIIHIEIEARNVSWTYPAGVVVLGDAKRALLELAQEVERSGGISEEAASRRQEAIQVARSQFGYFDARQLTSATEPLLPQRVIREIQHMVPDDAFICCDAGENRIFMTHYFQTKKADTYIQPAGVGGMGYAIPAALAAKLVHPDRAAIAVCGDGGFAMAMNGLLTALEEKIPIVVVVFNNAALGWVKHGQGERVIASEFADFDFAAIALAMGCDAVRVESAQSLKDGLQAALGSNRPAVIDVCVSLEESFADILSSLVRR